MEKPSVLIVGAGALGIVTGYHLHLAGAEIAFLVRPNRTEALSEPQRLYCYDDHELKTFGAYKVFTSVTDAMAREHDFVIVTMDGATCRGAEATALLREIGQAMQGRRSVAVISGMGVRDYCRDVMQLPEARIVTGTMGLLSYQTDRVTLPPNPPTDQAKLASASIAYNHMGKNPGFLIVAKPAAAAKAFAALYDRSGVSRCAVIGPRLFDMFSASAFVTMAIFDLAGWPDAGELARNTALMDLASRATKEIMRLPEHGVPGKIAGLLVSPRQLAKTNRKMERDCLPVDYSAFNRFHHGGKVRDQDIGVLRSCLQAGRAHGRSMPALTELVERYERHIAEAAG
ncbi:hypothetical protein B2G71_09505 [Novosphingobium sp. PC22D]|uniref:ketopantoate reductase family protein n=1 Tax=Novosphingobium sp. PC22D TaxID=1962403 RepID=UPI000BF19828|nr:2-dehydropantoate 2-reductase N-terminal domain-containing protein [Novosphingobium sp. PC22D]PEQ13049.1 hypothetical protein B2G71_09505 [Novosphingobium sp. PC22D]